jgi:hypothetical protein
MKFIALGPTVFDPEPCLATSPRLKMRAELAAIGTILWSVPGTVKINDRLTSVNGLRLGTDLSRQVRQ